MEPSAEPVLDLSPATWVDRDEWIPSYRSRKALARAAARDASEAALAAPPGQCSMDATILMTNQTRRQLAPEYAVIGTSGETSTDPSRRMSAYLLKREKERKRECLEIVKARVCGIPMDEIAAAMNLQMGAAWQRLAEGRRKKWVLGDDEERINHEMIPAIVDGVTALMVARDKDALLQGARGVGIFKSHQAIKTQNQSVKVLQVRIIHERPGGGPGPDDAPNSTVMDVTQFGNPRLLEGEVVKEQEADHAVQSSHGEMGNGQTS